MHKTSLVFLSVFLTIAAYLQLPSISQYDSKRILQLVLFLTVGILVLISVIKDLSKYRQLKRDIFEGSRLLYISVALLFITGLLSVILASHFKYALLEFSFFFLLLSLITVLTPSNLKQHYFLGKLIFATALIFSGLYIIIFMGNYISSFLNPMIALWPEKYNFILTIDGVDLKGKEVLYFDNKRFFNHIQTWTIPILIGFLTYYKRLKKNKVLEIILVLLISFWWMLLFAAGARGSLMGIILAFFIILFIVREDAYKLLKNGIITLFFGGIFYSVFFKFFKISSEQVPLARDFTTGYVRLDLLEKGFTAWWQDPLFGIGPMHHAKIDSAEPWYASIHNFYIQFLSEWGLIAFCALSILGIIFFKSVYKNYIQSDRNFSNNIVYITFAWSIIAAVIHAMFSGIMITPMSQIWFVLLASWFLGFNRLKSISNGFKYNPYFIRIVYTVLLGIVLWISLENMSNIANHYSEYFSNYPESKFYPRFWVQGLFD